MTTALAPSSPEHRATHERHQPENTPLWRAVRGNWKTFLADLEAATEAPMLPGFVVAEVEAFLKSGILGHGFIRCCCKECGWCRAVAFSCCPEWETISSSHAKQVW